MPGGGEAAPVGAAGRIGVVPASPLPMYQLVFRVPTTPVGGVTTVMPA
jgi:hypothetical protein